MTALVVIICGMGAAWYFSRRPVFSAHFQPRLSEFIWEASRLATLAGRDVDHTRYVERLASTTAAYESLATAWPSDYKKEARNNFTIALREWSMVNEFWKRALQAYPDGSFGLDQAPATVQDLEAAAPGQVVFFSEEPKAVDVESSISRMLEIAARHYQSGLALILE